MISSPPMVGVPLFAKWSLGPVISYLLTELDLLQLPDHPGGQDEGNEERRHCSINNPETLIPKDIQEANIRV